MATTQEISAIFALDYFIRESYIGSIFFTKEYAITRIIIQVCHLVPPSPVLDPTVLERDDPIQLPMDLLIHDEKDEDVIFEVNAARRNPNITCNPLYEHSLRDEEAEKFSLKSFQSGFKTDFDNVNFIRVGQLCQWMYAKTEHTIMFTFLVREINSQQTQSVKEAMYRLVSWYISVTNSICKYNVY